MITEGFLCLIDLILYTCTRQLIILSVTTTNDIGHLAKHEAFRGSHTSYLSLCVLLVAFLIYRL